MGAVLIMAIVPLRVWLGLANPAYILALVLIALVPLVGVEALGAKRWINLGAMNFQPSELMKVALVPALARYYQWLPPDRVSQPLWVALPLAMILVPAAFVLKQPDLGSAALFVALGLSLMFLAGVSVFYYIAGAVLRRWSNAVDPRQPARLPETPARHLPRSRFGSAGSRLSHHAVEDRAGGRRHLGQGLHAGDAEPARFPAREAYGLHFHDDRRRGGVRRVHGPARRLRGAAWRS